MKVAVVFNRESKNVINLFGRPNQEKIGLETIRRIVEALKARKHQVTTIEGDMHLVERLGEYMPRVVKGERPGMVFNLSYGIQGQARYTHVPSILEMVGIPYVGSGPLAHSLALDKVVTKMLLREHGVPTPDFAVLSDPTFAAPDLAFPLIVKPKNEAVSFGIQVVHDEAELREAAGIIFDRFDQPVLAEQYVDGREINVGLLGNNPPEVFPPAEIVFGEKGPRIYTYEDKTRRSGREVGVACPAQLSPEATAKAQDIALRAFSAIGCYDCARVDMRMDAKGDFYVLEINSLPSMGEHGSYTHAAQVAGYDYAALVNRLVDVATARYFGTVQAQQLGVRPRDGTDDAFTFLTNRRDEM
ncbi:MAG: D-alanine--D-alanine ligase family protein, partial [Planctomycetota bacterium]